VLFRSIRSASSTTTMSLKRSKDSSDEESIVSPAAMSDQEDDATSIAAAIKPPELRRSDPTSNGVASFPGAFATFPSSFDFFTRSSARTASQDFRADDEDGLTTMDGTVCAVPHAVEVKMAPAVIDAEKLTTKRSLAILWLDRRFRTGFLFIVLIVFSVTVALFVGIEMAEGEDHRHHTVAPPDSTTIPFIFNNSAVVKSILPLLSDISDLEKADSPQARAMHWISGTDNEGYSIKRKVQRFALACLYYSLGGSKWSHSQHWITNKDECTDWHSSDNSTSRCNENGDFVNLNLVGNGLQGKLIVDLNLLSALETIRLNENRRLTGSLPTSVGLLTNLSVLAISGTSINGNIPTEFGALLKLQALQCDETLIQGTIPSEIGAALSLTLLDISASLLSGIIPTELENLEHLEVLALNDNRLNGTLPSELFGGLTKLRIINLENNLLTGILPSSVGQLKNLETLRICENNINGTLPESLGHCISIQVLDVSNNALTGTIPEFNNNKSLSLVLFGNRFTSLLSDSLCASTTIEAQLDCNVDCNCCGSCLKFGEAWYKNTTH